MSQVARPGLHVFLVEDHADTRACIEQFLLRLGHSVQSAGTMEAALAGIDPDNCQLLICDLGLPDGDGWALLKELKTRAFFCHVYTVAVSGYGTRSDVAASEAAGFRQHLVKPLSPDVLRHLLEEATSALQTSDGSPSGRTWA